MARSKMLKYIVYLLAGLAIGVFFFFPWSALCDDFMARGLSAMSANGIYGVVRSNECRGLIDKVFAYENISVDFPAFRVTTRETLIDPLIFKTIFTASPSCRVTFGKGDFTPVTRQKVSWNSGEAKVKLKNGTFFVDEIKFLGDFSVSGSISFSTKNRGIQNADLRLKLPAEMDRPMQLISGSGVLPITKTSSGEWRVKK